MNAISIRLLIAALTTLTLAGCMENGATPTTGGSTTSVKASGFGATLPAGSADGAFSLTKAVRSNQDPTNMLELLTGSGEIGNFCPTSASCKCRFDWLESDGTFREVDQDLAYVETNLARCLFTQVSPNASYFDVKLVVVQGGSASNAYRVGLVSANPAFNPALASNYVKVDRYLCRDNIRLANNTAFYNSGGPGGGNLLDPRLWDMGYAVNFYTSSFGLDYGATASGGAAQTQGWECPPIPNDISYNSSFDLKLYSLAPIDLTNPLLTNVVTGDNTIFPSSDNLNATAQCPTGVEAACEQFRLNRHDYFLSSFQDGTFKQPVCMIHKVANRVTNQLNCTVDASKGPAKLGSTALAKGGQDIVGFGAIPDASQNCPNSNAVALPSGKKWAKLWKFRGSLPIRTVQDVANFGTIGQLFCTNRKQECQSGATVSGGSTRSVCWSVGNTGGAGTSTGSGPTIGPQQSQAIGATKYGNCKTSVATGDSQNPLAGDGSSYVSTGCTTGGQNCCKDFNDSTVAIASRLPANYTPGGDWCNPSLVGSNNASNSGGVASDNWLISQYACIEGDTDINGKFNMSFPDPLSTYQLSARTLEQNSMTDYVYVVSPTNVTIEQMQNPNDLVAQQYIPKRYLPNSPTPIVYGLDTDSSNSSINSTRPSSFPLCVLQDTK